MSVEAYLKKVEDGAKKAIQKNAEYIASHPYPKDLLAEVVKPLGDKSVLNKIFGPSGRKKSLGSFTPDEIIAAKEEASVYPTLWRDLTSGNTSLILEEKNAIINNSNHENELKNAYSQFREKIPVEQKVAGSSEFTINYIFKNLPDKDFLDEIALQTDFDLDFNLNTYGADDLVKAAFMELYEKDSGVKTGSQPASTPIETKKTSESSKSPVNSIASQSTGIEEKTTTSINSGGTGQSASSTTAGTPINPSPAKSSEPTSVTSSDGTITSKAGELQTENILATGPSQAVNINLESKPTESKPATEATSSSTAVSTTSTSTTVNDATSASSVTSNPSNTSNTTEVTGDKNIVKVENTNNQSTSSTVNEDKPKKEKGGFLSKVGNFAKKAGAALNLPSIGELGEQAKGLFGATGANISSRISEVKNSFAINSNKEESNASPTSSTTTNSVNSSTVTPTTKPNILAVPNTEKTSTASNLLKTETQTAMNVEQSKPTVTATPSVSGSNLQSTNSTSSAVSNTSNSQNTSSPQTTTSATSQNTQSTDQSSGNPAGVGVNVDMNQLAQSITRLERILISGIEVTIKDT